MVRFFVLICAILILRTSALAQKDTVISWTTYTVAWGYITRTLCPVDFQLYPRDSSNHAQVGIGGSYSSADSIKIVCRKMEGRVVTQIYSEWLPLSSGHFSTAVTIEAGLFEYYFYYRLSSQPDSVLAPIASHVVCGDVFVVSGQSNVDTWDLTKEELEYLNTKYGPGYYTGASNPYAQFCRSYEAGLPVEIFPPWSLSAVAHYGYRHLGAWGLVVQNELVKRYQVPVLFINNAVGGTDITNNHLPGPDEYFFTSYTYTICPVGAEESPTKTYRLFSRLNSNIYLAGVEKHVKGIFWLQGDAGKFDRTHGYLYEFRKMHDLWMKFFPGFKTYLIQVHSWTESEDAMRQVSEEQRTIPDSIPNVYIMSANGIGFHRKEFGHEIHFRREGYENLAYRLLGLVENTQYGKTEVDVSPPDVIGASRSGNTIRVYFNQMISSMKSDSLNHVISLIKFNSGYNIKSQPSIVKNKLVFSIVDTAVSTLSYAGFIPGKMVNGIYSADPDFTGYLRNKNGIAALSFHRIPIVPYDATSTYEKFVPPGDKIAEIIIPGEYKYFPNPVVDSLHIEVPEKALELTVTNVQGVVVLKQALDTYTFEVDLSILPGGVYFVTVVTEKNKHVTRIIKM